MAYIVGASGAGKSSILKLLLREKVATKGTVLVNGYDLGKLKQKNIPIFSPLHRRCVSGFPIDPDHDSL